jgi:hypothetical protein
MMYKITTLIVIVFLGTFGCAQNAPMKRTDCKRILGEVCLRDESAKMLTEIEKLYGKPIRLVENTKYDVGNSRIEDDGTPVIEINPSIYSKDKLHQEAGIVHELFHLKMRATGFPIIGFEPTDLYKRNSAFFDEMIFLVFSPIEHRTFFPQMRKIGLNPSAEIEEYFMHLDRRAEVSGPTNDYQRAVFFMRAALEFNDPKLLAELEQWYKAKQWNKPLAVGKELAKVVNDSRLRSAEDQVTIFVRCMEVLLGDVAKFSLVGWEERHYGPIMVRIGVLRVMPA